MDMAPPQAPPAPVTVTAAQAATLVHRLEAAGASLSAMQDTQPLVALFPGRSGRDDFLSSLDTWWSTDVGANAGSPHGKLMAHIVTAMRDDAMLRSMDGTLGTEDAGRLVAFALSNGTLLPPDLEARELLVGDTPYAGAIIVASADSGRAWLFMPDRGWEGFGSLSALHEETEDRLRHELVARDTLPGLRVIDADRLANEPDASIRSRRVAGPAILAMANGIQAMQRVQVGDAWALLDAGDAPEHAADAVRAALDLQPRLDIEAMARDRERRRNEARQADRLAAAPPSARADWLEAASALRDALFELARFENTVGTAEGDALPQRPRDPDAVRAHRDALIATLDANDDASRVRQAASVTLARRRFAMAAADARLGYFLPGDAPAFIEDRAERGYQWLKAVADAPVATNRRRIEGHAIVVRQFTYRGAVLSGVLAIGAEEPASVPRLVLYTPDAPDGRTIREFEDAAGAAREFLHDPRFEAWLLERLPASHGYLDSHGVRRFVVPEETRTAAWAFGQPGAEGATRTAEAFDTEVVDGDVFKAMRATHIARMVRDMTELESAMHAADAAPAWHAIRTIADNQMAGGRLVTETIAGIGKGLRAMWRMEDAIRAGDYRGAFVDGTEAYVHLLPLVSVGHLATRPGPLLQGIIPRPPSGHSAAARIEWPRAFDARYAARDINLAGTQADAAGIHTVSGRRYVVSSGTAYEVRFDTGNQTWRLVHPNHGDAVFSGPAIGQAWDGWHIRTDIGLRGGGRRAPLASPPTGHQPSAWRTANEADLDPLTAHQRAEFLRVLRQRLGGAMADDLHIEVLLANGQPVRVGRVRFDAWSDALHAARHTPPLPPAPPPSPTLAPGLLWREVPPGEWPDTVWYYPARAVEALDQPTLYLPAVRVRGSGLSGLVASPLDPALWQARGSTARHGWVQVDLHRLRGTGGADGRPALRVFVNDSRGTPHFVLRTAGEVQGNFLVLRPGEFSTGG